MENIKESGLSRIYNSMLEHDTGTITAYRSTNTRSENQDRNRLLLAKLMKLGYGVTSVKGSYIENYGTKDAIEVGESSFFVVDLKDRNNLKKDLIELGTTFNQDSILFIYKGGDKSILIGTNNAEFPGYLKEISMGKFGGGQSGEFFSRVNGRPFIFKESTIEHINPTNVMGKMALQKTINNLECTMELTKPHLIEGKIYEKGTELRIKESSLDYDIDNRLGVLTVYQKNDEVGFLYEDVKDLVNFMKSSSKTFMVETGAMVFKKNGNTIKISLSDLDNSIVLTKDEILELERIADSSNKISKRSSWY